MLFKDEIMDFAITGLSMITSVGRDVVSSCAAIRSGISRPREIDYFEVLDLESQDAVPLVGHPIRGFTEGFNLVGLWIRIAKVCLLDLIKQENLPDKSDIKFWQKTALIGSLPYINDDRFLSDEDATTDLVKETYLYQLHEELDIAIPLSNLHVVCMGHTAAIAAIAVAKDLMSSANIERVIVLAVDSYLDTLTLEWLYKYNRLKTSANPIGLSPGEAGACFLLESTSACNKRNAPVYALVEGFGIGKEINNYFSEEVNRGVGLSRVIEQSLNNTSLDLPFIGDLISDQNGENWRARELAGARILMSKILNMDSPLIFPSMSIGDVGSASGGIFICIAVRSFIKHYSHGKWALILTSTEHGDVGATCLRMA